MHDLKEQLEALADEGTARGAAAVMSAARRSLDDAPPVGYPLVPQRSRRRHVAVAFVFAVLLVVALIVSSVVFLGSSAERTSRVVPVVPGENDLRDLFVASDAPSTSASPLYLVPGYVPGGMEPFLATGGNRPGFVESFGQTPSNDEQQLWAKFDAAGDRPVATFLLQSGPGEPGDPVATFRSDSVALQVRGHAGLYDATRHSLAWEEPTGRFVGITGESLTRPELVGIAAGLQPRSNGWTATQAPPGFVQVSVIGDVQSEGTNARDLIYRDATGHAFRVRVADDTTSPPGHKLASGMFGRGADPRLVEVRGHHAVLTNAPSEGSFDSQTSFMRAANRFVEWLEPGNVRVTVSGLGLGDAEILAIARGLRVVGQAAWDDLVVRAPDLNGAGPVSPSTQPPTFKGEQAAVADAFRVWLNATNADEAAAAIENGDSLRGTFAALQARSPGAGPFGGRVDAVRLVGRNRALVTFSLGIGGPVPSFGNQQGAAVRVDGRWLVSRATYCSIVTIVSVQCSAP